MGDCTFQIAALHAVIPRAVSCFSRRRDHWLFLNRMAAKILNNTLLKAFPIYAFFLEA
jgi:hypothetical protein